MPPSPPRPLARAALLCAALSLAAWSLAACSQGGYDHGAVAAPEDRNRSEAQASSLERYLYAAGDLSAGCSLSLTAEVSLPQEVAANPTLSTDLNVRRRVAFIMGLDEADLQASRSAVYAAFGRGGASTLVGLEFDSAPSASKAVEMTKQYYDADGAHILQRGSDVLLLEGPCRTELLKTLVPPG